MNLAQENEKLKKALREAVPYLELGYGALEKNENFRKTLPEFRKFIDTVRQLCRKEVTHAHRNW